MYHIEKTDDFDIIHIQQNHIRVSLLNYGASILQIQTPNHQGVFEDVLLAYENYKDYIDNSIYLNATIGPIAGRIKNGLIKTDQQTYQFNKNQNNKHTLHSSDLSLAYKLFDYQINDSEDKTIVKMSYNTNAFQDLDYQIHVTYTITNHICQINYDTMANRDFFFSLTNHAYFNLSGNLAADIKNHIVQILTKDYHELDQNQLSTGNIKQDTLYDFTKPRSLKQPLALLKNHPYHGYDDIFMFKPSNEVSINAIIVEPKSQRRLTVLSDYDHMVFYTHNNINQQPLKHLYSHMPHYGLCFECQKAPYGFKQNQLIKSNQHDKHTIIFEFDLVK